jgi:hypothetical protein
MKIVLIDKYRQEGISDIIIAENVPETYAKEIADYLNNQHRPINPKFYDSCYYSVRPNNYVLYKFKSFVSKRSVYE